MDIPGWIRLTLLLEGEAVWLQTRHITAVAAGDNVTYVSAGAHDEPLTVVETVDEVMRLIDAANAP